MRCTVGMLLAVAASAMLTVSAGAQEKKGQTIDLFNGKDFTGWTFHLREPDKKLADVWSVADGVITCKGKPAGYIRTEKDYMNYILELDWRFDPAKGAGNSGVLLRMVGTDKVWPKSIEAQLASQNAGDIWNIDMFLMDVAEERTEGRRTKKMKPTNEKPLGEWNHYKITLDDDKLTLEVNGEVQNTATEVEDVPGKICLQSEGAEIQFRNIRLTPIEK